MNTLRSLLVLLSLPLLVGPLTRTPQEAGATSPGEYLDALTLRTDRHLWHGIEARNGDGTFNVVVEIPTGTTAKWEVDKDDGWLHWERKNGAPRIVKYLGYPGNYGMLPRTLLPKEAGGDGDPLDVIVLGEALPRGTVVRARLLGVLALEDGGEQDDKLVAVIEGGTLAAATDVFDLERRFPGVQAILRTWFENYKGPGEIESSGYRGLEPALGLFETAAAAYREREAR